MVGHGESLRVENRVPGGDVNPYLAVAALIAAGLHGIENELPLEPEFARQRLRRRQAAGAGDHAGRGRAARREQARRGPRSATRSSSHYLNNARVELAAYDAAVTDWERIRGFERL